jgi:hypothetical protein
MYNMIVTVIALAILFWRQLLFMVIATIVVKRYLPRILAWLTLDEQGRLVGYRRYRYRKVLNQIAEEEKKLAEIQKNL